MDFFVTVRREVSRRADFDVTRLAPAFNFLGFLRFDDLFFEREDGTVSS